MRRTAAIATLALVLTAVALEPALAAPKPRLGRTVVLKPAGGTVIVKPRGEHRFKLRGRTVVPMRTTVDTTDGRVKLTSARRSGGRQRGVFSKGAFVVTQRRRDGLTDLRLTGGDFGVCAAARVAGRRVTGSRRRTRRRRLFGRAHGRFRTRGRNSSATVRGTTWLTEDRCDGTVTKNMSPDPDSKVKTSSRELEFDLDPGQTATWYCNRRDIQPDTYCLALLAQPADGLIGAGIITQVDRPDYALCVRAPDGTEGCYRYPLSERDEDGFRLAVLACPVGAPGQYLVGWSLDFETLLYPGALSLTLDVAGPPVPCQSEPPVPAAYRRTHSP